MMKVADYIVEFLIRKGVTDVFGLPGGVVLNFLYALDNRKDEIKAHLCFHEQSVAFAACGYAQAESTLGVAYATRGPGVTNMITGIADAYYDSIPVLFISAHMKDHQEGDMRIEMDQELNPMPLLSSITKYATRVNQAKDVCHEIEKAYYLATTGRKGPVFLDFSAHIFNEDIRTDEDQSFCQQEFEHTSFSELIESIDTALECSQRPVLLIGDGIRQSNTVQYILNVVERIGIPVLSSRFAQDIMPKSALYFGYIGSHALRYSNFILSKADLIISLGNRLSFPVDSKSYGPLVNNTKIIRIDVDETEFLRKIPNSKNFIVNLHDFLPILADSDLKYEGKGKWLSVCRKLKDILQCYDLNDPVNVVSAILRNIGYDTILTNDVGNNEFWVSRAYTYAKAGNRTLFSKSFGAMGCSLPKAIGAHYATQKPVLCFTGDQGLQMNLQELQYIANHDLPIAVVLLNNQSSGMIRSREKKL
ncbi:thiamine pyrophosphate-binding protein, partial [bacterium]|nr:thiamine pyrophosphate-binding protein [candidate division CSSED10-310 bacterium]